VGLRVVRRCSALAFLASTLVPPPAVAAELPLGPRSLDEQRAVARVAPGVRWTRIVREGGPWRVNVLSVAPTARVLVAPAGEIGERAHPSAVSRRLRAVAAVNGGYFGADGNPVGVLAAGGRLLSEPVGGRSALLLGAGSRVAALRFAGSVSVGGEAALLDGVNRTPGEIAACGGRGGDRPTERPDAATTCTDPSELVLFTPEWAGRTPSDSVAAAPRKSAAAASSASPAPAPRASASAAPRTDLIVRDGLVSASRSRGGTRVPADGFVLAGTGRGARLLGSAGQPGAPVTLDLSVGAELGAGIVGGGPRLLTRGRVRVRSSAEGFDPLTAPWFHGSFVAARHPRTLAGVRADGPLLLVTIDGRRPGWSAGVTLREAARVMRSLGARQALNLDGGGSTAMAVRGRVVSRPSDPTGERPVSDSLVVLP
jgi:hypothetical protein